MIRDSLIAISWLISKKPPPDNQRFAVLFDLPSIQFCINQALHVEALNETRKESFVLKIQG
jgi:hypothetical protein